MNKRVSMRDVALAVGVSKSTVSHAINGTRFVDADTKKRILDVVEELGYHPSAAARSLTTNRRQIIGVVISDVSNSYFAQLLKGIEDVFLPNNYNLIVCNTNETLERESLYLDLLQIQQVDGIIAAATSQRWGTLDRAAQKNLPIVFVDRRFEGFDHLPYVGADNRGGAYLGTTHLIQRGYRQIGILAGIDRLSSMRERQEGFRQALRDNDIALPEEWVVVTLLNIESAYAAARKILLLPQRPQALFLSNNLLSLGTLLAIRELGLRCPEDIALIGFDDHAWAAVASPPLTVVRQPAEAIGRTAAEMLLTILNGDRPQELGVIMNCEVIARASC